MLLAPVAFVVVADLPVPPHGLAGVDGVDVLARLHTPGRDQLPVSGSTTQGAVACPTPAARATSPIAPLG